MPRAKKEGFLSSMKSVALGYLGGLEEKILKKTMKYALALVFASLGLVFLLFGLKDFLILYVPGYVAEAVLGAALLCLAMVLKRG